MKKIISFILFLTFFSFAPSLVFGQEPDVVEPYDLLGDNAPDDFSPDSLEIALKLIPGRKQIAFSNTKYLDDGYTLREDVDIFKLEADVGKIISLRVTPEQGRTVNVGINNSKLMNPPFYVVFHRMNFKIITAAAPPATRSLEILVKVNSKNTEIKNGKGVFYASVKGTGGIPYTLHYRILKRFPAI